MYFVVITGAGSVKWGLEESDKNQIHLSGHGPCLCC